MRTEQVAQLTPTVQEALRAFISTLLGKSAPLSIEAPSPASIGDLRVQAGQRLIVSGEGGETRFAVFLDKGWLGHLSQAMLGEAISPADPAAEDLVRELAGQAYGTVRSTLVQAGVLLPDVEFSVAQPGTPLSSGMLTDPIQELRFSMNIDGITLGGSAMLPAGVADSREASSPRRGVQGSASAVPGSESTVKVAPVSYPELGSEQLRGDGANVSFDLLADVDLEVTVELGRRKLPLADLLRLTTGSVVELEKFVGEPLDIYANGRFIAEGEAVVIDERFGIRITNLAATRSRGRAVV